jgi:hypothetical protein
MVDIKNKLDVLDKMIDHVQRKIRSNENIMGAINSTYEYDTFFGPKPNEDAINEMKLNVEALGILLKYRTDLMDYSIGVTNSEPATPAMPDGFKF